MFLFNDNNVILYRFIDKQMYMYSIFIIVSIVYENLFAERQWHQSCDE